MAHTQANFVLVGRVPATYASRVGALALVPALGGPLARDRAAAQLQALQRLWRRRISVLDDARDEARGIGTYSDAALGNWRPRRMIDCYPAVGIHAPVTPFCSGAGLILCPHCWARAAIAVWRDVDRRLFPATAEAPARRVRTLVPAAGVARPPTLAGRALVVRTLTTAPLRREASAVDETRTKLDVLLGLRATGRRAPADKDDAWPPRAVDFRRLAAAGAAGGVEVAAVDVVANTGFQIRIRQLLVVPLEAVAAFRADPFVRSRPDLAPRLRVYPEPRRADLMRLVAAVCEYPASLLRADATATIEYLAARRRRRLHATFGCLHGPLPGGDPEPDAEVDA
jgi:hypothetical protein